MSLSLRAVDLASRAIRSNSSRGVTGRAMLLKSAAPSVVRRISQLTQLKPKGEGGLIEKIWNGGSGLVGFVLGGALNAIGFSASKVFGWLLGGAIHLAAFNWNATDKEFSQMIESQEIALASLWGGVVGAGIGWLVGIGIGYGISFLCPVIGGAALARAVATKAGKEAIEEMKIRVKTAVDQTAQIYARNSLVSGYVQVRSLLKKAPTELLEGVFGKNNAQFIKNFWGNEGGADMSFNTRVDNFIEKIDNKKLQAFLESLVDEVWDSFTEAGFVVAQELDNAYAQHKQANKMLLGEERTVEITLDTQAPDEKLRLTKIPQTLITPILQQTINQHRLLYNRDVGQIMGMPEQSMGRASFQLRQLVVVFRSRPHPPWVELTGKRCRQASYAIPDVKTGLNWREIKAAADPYTWGKYRATANLDNRRQMAIYGASPAEAKRKLEELLRLSTAKILSLSVTEEDTRPVKLKKDPIRMYPTYATLLNRRNSLDGQGRVRLDGRVMDEESIRIPLWPQQEPRGLPPFN
jgi:hypothetical protein